MRTKAVKTAAIIGAAAALAAAGPAAAQQTTISEGHVDALSFSYDENANEIEIDVDLHEAGQVLDPADVTFDVHDEHLATLSDPIECRADTGDNWVLPRTEESGQIWAGWSTEGLDLSDFGGDIHVDLIDADTPSGGEVAVYDATSGTTRFHTDPACGASGTDITESHHHPTWVFTEPGTYELTFQAEGDHATDGAVQSDPVTYTFEVGGV
ncbi:choice-of-anchor M domain-containing protein [Glycomyces salinus]|uniref:choice-of-anchor M domain-containing protein n=1 Tax=Glycomyces salinus TaxID=980294 RepID=UPI0018EDE152|nr:choice-of-anchor M domain-containing protein [Glycomyces salinus]